MSCHDCGIEYPDEFLVPMMFSVGGELRQSPPVCGICALQRSNDALGVRRKKFTGELAEAKRQDAIRWRRKHGLTP